MTFANLTRDNIVDYIADIYARRGVEEYLAEPVSVAEHSLQAAQLAERANAPKDLIVAALLHDIGHFGEEFPEQALEQNIDLHHEALAARALRSFFPPTVVEPIRLHVNAKRYLCAVNVAYYNHLSEASKHTLRLQGGPMDEVEAKEFASNSYHTAAVQVRRWDDNAKTPGVATPSLDHYLPLLREFLM